jgi:hypothetical protein
MAHFARIQDGTVREVIVINNDACGGGDFPESEPIGQAFISSIELAGDWLQTSYNGSFRGIYAGIGYTYEAALDVFTPPPAPEITEE